MIRRKGELNHARIDSNWPHQVALPAVKVQGAMFYTTHYFCEGLSLCLRTKSFRRDNRDYVVFCFSEPEDAELFRQRFNGERVCPKSERRRASG